MTAQILDGNALGQKLRADPWMPPDYDWSQILAQAQGARGDDPYGYRVEAITLMRLAQSLDR